ncbi:MAG: PQQ-binding-like beta-propeller repeat protein [Planctomycetota bacterium]
MQRWYRICLAAAACALVGAGCRTDRQAVSGADWPGFGGPGMTGVSAETGLADRWGPDGPRRLWSVSMNRGWSSPAVADGRVYILDAHMGESESLLCLDLQTGRQIWSDSWTNTRQDRWQGSRTAPRVDQKRIYVLGHDGQLRCYRRADGKLLWNRNIHKEFPRRPRGPVWGYTCDPVLWGDLVIVAPSSFRTGLAAYRQDTGQLAWTSPPVGINSFSNQQPRLLRLGGVDQVVIMANQYVGKDPPAVVSGVEAETGRLLWQTLTPSACNVPIPPAVAIGPDKILLTAGYRMGTVLLQIVPRSQGDPQADPVVPGRAARVGQVRHYHRVAGRTPMMAQLLWVKPAPNCHIQMPILYRDCIWANSFDKFHQSKNLGLVCMDPNSGEILWSSGPDKTFANGPLLIAGDKIYIVDAIGGELSMVAADREGYRLLDSAEIFEGRPLDVWAPLALSEGKLLVRSQGELICLDVSEP